MFIRRLHASEQDDICDHFLRLDIQSRRVRFCGAVSEISVKKYAANIFKQKSIVCGATVDRQLRGLVELRGVFSAWRPITEAAFSVETVWQNRGIGDALFDRIFAIAQNCGVKTIQMMCLKENSRMKHLAAKHHTQLRLNHDAIEVFLCPHWPKPYSLTRELTGEAGGYKGSVLHQSRKLFEAKSAEIAKTDHTDTHFKTSAFNKSCFAP